MEYQSGFFLLLGLIIGWISMAIFLFKFLNLSSSEEEHEQIPHQDHGDVPVMDLGQFIVSKINEQEKVAMETATDIDNFKNKVSDTKEKYLKEEEYSKVAHLENLQGTIDSWFEERKKWFLSKVNKKIIPNKTICQCDDCKDMEKNGILIENKRQALSFFMNECMSKVENKEITYSDYEVRR